MLVPNITNICYGRGVGYKIEEIELSEEIQKISATKIRAKMREDGELKQFKIMNVIIKNLNNGIKNIIINDSKTYNSLSYKTLGDLIKAFKKLDKDKNCLLYTSPSPRDPQVSRMPSSA